MATTSHKLSTSDTFRPRVAFALHDPGSNKAHLGCTGAEADSLDRLLSDATPAHPKWVLRVRPSDTRQSVWSLRCQPIKTAVEPESGNALDGEQSPATRTRGSAAMREPEHQTAESSVTGGYAGEGIAVYPEALSRQGGRSAKPTKQSRFKTTGIRGALCPDETIGG